MFYFGHVFRMMMRIQNHLQRRKLLRNLKVARVIKIRKPETKEGTRRRTKKKRRRKANQVFRA